MSTHVYNLHNALNWTMAFSHIHEARYPHPNSGYCGRLLHLTVGICEAIPLVGQIVSLMELALVNYAIPVKIANTGVARKITAQPDQASTPLQALVSSYPLLPVIASVNRVAPGTVYPSTAVTIIQRKGEIRRYWPVDLSTLGISRKDQNDFDAKIVEAFANFKTIRSEGNKIIVKRTYLSHTFRLPLSVHIEKEQGIYRIILLAKKIFVSSGERDIYWAFDMTNGMFMIKKPVVGDFEAQIIPMMHVKRKVRGIESEVIWRTKGDQKQMIESLRAGTISILFNTIPFGKWSCKMSICKDLIDDLYDLQDIKFTNLSMKTHALSFTAKNYPAAHTDIKLHNVLAFTQDGKWRAELCDFGQGVGGASTILYSIGYTAPEYVDFLNRYKGYTQEQRLELVRFNGENCQKRDIWSLGLVLVSICVERTESIKLYHSTFDLPPFPSLKSRISILPAYPEQDVAFIKQAEIDTDLSKLQGETLHKHPGNSASINKVFDVIRTMLKVNPKERANIVDIKTRFGKDK
jgi:hypothetical protein